MRKVTIIFSIFILLGTPFANGQSARDTFNVNYNHFLVNPNAHMASFYGGDYSNVNIQHQTYTGLLSDIKELYSDIHYNSNEKHYLGIRFFNSRRTSLYTRSKAHITYAIKVPIASDINWVTGTQIGLVNVFFGQSEVTSGGSAWGFDAGLSTTLNVKEWEIGIAIQQIPSTTLNPILYTFQLSRYMESMIIKNFEIDINWKLKSGIRTIINTSDTHFQIDNRLQYKDVASILFSSEGLNPKSISIGFEYITQVNDNALRTTLAYQVSDSRTTFNSGQVMIGIGYTL